MDSQLTSIHKLDSAIGDLWPQSQWIPDIESLIPQACARLFGSHGKWPRWEIAVKPTAAYGLKIAGVVMAVSSADYALLQTLEHAACEYARMALRLPKGERYAATLIGRCIAAGVCILKLGVPLAELYLGSIAAGEGEADRARAALPSILARQGREFFEDPKTVAQPAVDLDELSTIEDAAAILERRIQHGLLAAVDH